MTQLTNIEQSMEYQNNLVDNNIALPKKEVENQKIKLRIHQLHK